MDLPSIWFVLVALLLTGYAVLDGFDLGVGILHLTTKGDRERRISLNSIGPVWDGNEVWLVTGGGALFAAFPHVYATVFSGFYLAFMLFLLALILRAVSLEFRGKSDTPSWRTAWDAVFSVGSTLAALLLGVAFGNIVRGIPLGPDYDFTGTFPSLLNPFALSFGASSVVVMTLHGSLYLHLKTEGGLKRRFASLGARAGIAIPLVVLALAGIAFAGSVPVREALASHPLLWLLPLLAAGSGASIPFLLERRPTTAFAASGAAIALTLAFFFSSLYPNLVYSPGSPQNSLTVLNAASSPLTLKIMLIITAVVFPAVLLYTAWVYRTFRGPVKLDPHSY